MPDLPFRLEINDGLAMPVISVGVYQAKPEETAATVWQAIIAGYRTIDTAAIYGNEREVGAVIPKVGSARSAR